MSTNHEISKIDDLITTLIDSVKGYDHSAQKVDSPDLKALFIDLATQRRAAVECLQQAMVPARSGTRCAAKGSTWPSAPWSG